MQQRCSILAIFIYEFSSYQSYLYPTTLAYSKKPIQIQYISGSHYPSALLKKKKVFKGLVKVNDALYWLR